MTAAIVTLNPAALATLADCELRIERGLKSFVDVGEALATIRDSRLYRRTHATFEDYCAERWNLKRQRAYELMNAAAVVSEFSDTDIPAPAKESHAAALAAVPEADRAEVWRDVVEGGDKPTAAAIRKAAEARTQTPGPTDAADCPPADPGVTPESVEPPSTVPAGSGAEVVASAREDAGAATEAVDADRAAAAVAAALDKFVPDVGAPKRAWVKKFYELTGAPHTFLLWLKSEDVAAYADDQDMTTLKHLADGFAEAYRRAVEARTANVTPLRRIK